MTCAACEARYFLLAAGIGGIVLFCHSFEKGASPVGFVLSAYRQRLPLPLGFLKLNLSLISNLFSFFGGFFNGLNTCLHV